jgi:DNA-binding IclR family transcriptional regulator
MNTTDRPTSSIQVIDRMAHLLDAIAAEDSASLKVLAAETGLHPSTAFRILAALGVHGFVERTAKGRYRLGTKLLRWGVRLREEVDIRGEARPIMERLRDRLGETVNLAVREGDEVVYVERATTTRVIRVEQVIGSRAPLHLTAVGKLFLAGGGAEACLEYAERTGLPAYTENSIAEATALWRAAKAAGQQGYALDDQEAELGVGCIAVPVRDATGEMVAGLSISAPIERRREEWIAQVREAGAQLSARLGFTAARPASAEGGAGGPQRR